jgi:hypothetical protein
MKGATIAIRRNHPEEEAAFEAWMQKWRPHLARISENYGSISIGGQWERYDVEGPDEAIDALPDHIQTSSEWTLLGHFAGTPRPKPRPWWKFW